MQQIELYNDILKRIKEPQLTRKEAAQLTLEPGYSNRDVYLNVRKTLLSRGLLENEMQKLALCAKIDGVDLSAEAASDSAIPQTNIFIGSAL